MFNLVHSFISNQKMTKSKTKSKIKSIKMRISIIQIHSAIDKRNELTDSQNLFLLRSNGGVEWKSLRVKERRLGFVWVKVVLNALFIFCYANLEFGICERDKVWSWRYGKGESRRRIEAKFTEMKPPFHSPPRGTPYSTCAWEQV